MSAGSYNFVIDQGATTTIEFDYLNDDGTIVDLTGYTASCQIRTTATAASATVTTTPSINTALGRVTLALSATNSALLTESTYVYEIQLTKGSDVVSFIKGVITTDPEIVR